MAALAVPAIEAVVAHALVLIGIGAAAGVAGEAVRGRQKEAERASATPITRAGTQTKAKEKCEDCAPDKGRPHLHNTAGWSDDSITYQVRIAQMPSAPPGFLIEWDFRGVKFDGFNSAQCLLLEAKARYDQFFDDWGGFRYPFQSAIFTKMTVEAVSRNNAAVPKPPVQLRWHFMEPTSYRYMSKVLLRATPEIEVLFRP